MWRTIQPTILLLFAIWCTCQFRPSCVTDDWSSRSLNQQNLVWTRKNTLGISDTRKRTKLPIILFSLELENHMNRIGD